MFKYVCLVKFQNIKTALEIVSLIYFWYRWEGKSSLRPSHRLDKLTSSSCRLWRVDV